MVSKVRKRELDYSLKVRLPITVALVAISFALTYFVSRAERDGVGYTPSQPIAYSHKLHAGDLNIDCQYCHTGADKSRHAMVPPTETCMSCHKTIKIDSPEIQKLKEYYDSDTPIPWQRVHKIPDYAYFDHSVHINKGLDCTDCHAEVKNMELVEQAHAFTMTNCLDCHRTAHDKFPGLDLKAKGTEDCITCHR